MKKVLSFSVGLIFIANYLSAQAVGTYISVATGNWSSLTTWNQGNGAAFVPATSYPGQNPGTTIVTISLGTTVTLDVSISLPNAIGSLALIIGTGSETLNISDGFTLNVAGGVLIAGAQTGGGATKTLSLNGPTATLNCASLTLTPGNTPTKLAILQFNGGGNVHVTGNLDMAPAGPDALQTQINFTGGAGGTLTVDGNLTGAGLMAVGNTAGTSTLNISGILSTVGNLTMNGAAATLDLNGNLSVSGILTLTAGKIDIGPNILTLSGTPATQLTGGGATSYVFTTSAGGRVRRVGLTAATNFTIPVGTSANYMPVVVNTAAGVSDFQASVYTPAALNATVGGPPFTAGILLRMVNAMWFIDRPVGSGNSALTLAWVAGLEGATFAGLANTQIGISHHNGISWSVPPIQTSGNNSDLVNTVTATFSVFGGAFAVADIGQVLPVKFGSIKAYEKQNGIQLDWKVYSENKVMSYEVERSADGRSYTTVGSLPALYNNINEGDYGFFDANPLAGTSYYRIKNNDLDGRSAYSIVIRVNRNKAIHGLSLYPNPVLNRIVSLQGSDLGRGKYKISIFGSNGQEIYKQLITHNGGTISQTIELPTTISKGIYMFTVKDENGNIIFNDKLVNQ